MRRDASCAKGLASRDEGDSRAGQTIEGSEGCFGGWRHRIPTITAREGQGGAQERVRGGRPS